MAAWRRSALCGCLLVTRVLWVLEFMSTVRNQLLIGWQSIRLSSWWDYIRHLSRLTTLNAAAWIGLVRGDPHAVTPSTTTSLMHINTTSSSSNPRQGVRIIEIRSAASCKIVKSYSGVDGRQRCDVFNAQIFKYYFNACAQNSTLKSTWNSNYKASIYVQFKYFSTVFYSVYQFQILSKLEGAQRVHNAYIRQVNFFTDLYSFIAFSV